MKTIAKVGVGCLVALLLVCLVGAGVFFFAGNWVRSKAKGVFGDFVAVQKSAEAGQKLNEKYPFTEPADGAVTEDRLEVYLSVCGEIKPAADRYEAWVRSKQGHKQGDFKDAKEAMNLTAGVMEAAANAMDRHAMSPREFLWIQSAMSEAAAAPKGPSLTEGQQQLIRVLQSQVDNPDTPEDQREQLRGQIEQIRGEAGAEAAPSGPNAELYARYADRLREAEPTGLGALLIQGLAKK